MVYSDLIAKTKVAIYAKYIFRNANHLLRPMVSNGTYFAISIVKNVLYHLKCCSGHGNTSSTGKKNDFRLRMNNHISSCRLGTSTDKFDNHVFNCRAKNNYTLEPYFKMYAFMEIADERLLLTYESYLHKKAMIP